jgi:hypothetical protein
VKVDNTVLSDSVIPLSEDVIALSVGSLDSVVTVLDAVDGLNVRTGGGGGCLDSFLGRVVVGGLGAFKGGGGGGPDDSIFLGGRGGAALEEMLLLEDVFEAAVDFGGAGLEDVFVSGLDWKDDAADATFPCEGGV